MNAPQATEGATPDGGTVARVSSATFRYDGSLEAALTDVSFAAEQGASHAIVGPNGSGKSTLLKLLTGALSPESGEVVLWGRSVAEWPPRDLAQRLAVVTQREAPAFPVSVRALVASGRYAHQGAFRREDTRDRESIDRALEQCGIPHLSNRSVRELSGGEFQRARIARALAQEPQILVLDEPTASLDVRYQMALLELLTRLRRERGLTLVFVTHRLALAARFADRLLLMSQGRVVADGSPSAVLESGSLSDVYGWPLAVVDVEIEGAEAVAQVIPLSSEQATSDQ